MSDVYLYQLYVVGGHCKIAKNKKKFDLMKTYKCTKINTHNNKNILKT